MNEQNNPLKSEDETGVSAEINKEINKEIKAKWRYWLNIKSKKNKTLLILICIALAGLKIFTTVLTFEWLAGFFN
jgi:hypothetical protein